MRTLMLGDKAHNNEPISKNIMQNENIDFDETIALERDLSV
jgi:hypothetical protein